jgi:tellurite resistance protein TehA-like permease
MFILFLLGDYMGTPVADVTLAVPYKSQWLDGIGLAFFFLNLCLFVLNCVLISLRFYWQPGSLVDSFTDQVESLFISAIVSVFLNHQILCEACGLLT